MLYTHNLGHLNLKSAELESVYIVRDLRQKMPFPITEPKFNEYLTNFLVSDTDQSRMELGLLMVGPALELLNKLLSETYIPEADPMHEPSEVPKPMMLYESANIQRAMQILQEMPPALDKNIQFGTEMLGWQSTMIRDAASVFNMLPRLRTTEEKIVYNAKLNELFQRVLRNQEFVFNFTDIVHEAHVELMKGLLESMNKGFLFHYTLEEELRKASFDEIKRRIPQVKLDEAETIKRNMLAIKNAIDRAYELNQRMVSLAVVLYSCMKWVKG